MVTVLPLCWQTSALVKAPWGEEQRHGWAGLNKVTGVCGVVSAAGLYWALAVYLREHIRASAVPARLCTLSLRSCTGTFLYSTSIPLWIKTRPAPLPKLPGESFAQPGAGVQLAWSTKRSSHLDLWVGRWWQMNSIWGGGLALFNRRYHGNALQIESEFVLF